MLKSIKRRGADLERLIAMLETVLIASDAIVESPSRQLRDRDTGRVREHDVLITWNNGHHKIFTAIECRDRSRPVGVPDVEAFADKCRATGVHSGVIVSSRGFRQSARQKAQVRAITCMDLSEVEEFDWLKTDVLVHIERQATHIGILIDFDGPESDSMADVVDGDGNVYDQEKLARLALIELDRQVGPARDVCEGVEVSLNLDCPGWLVRDFDGKVWPFKGLIFNIKYNVIRSENNFTRHSYVGGGKEYSIATADMSLGHQAGKIVMVQEPGDVTRVYWTRNPHPNLE